MIDKRFCELETAFTGEKIDNIKQLTHTSFTGEELKEYVEHFIDAEIIEAVKAENEACAIELDILAGFFTFKNENLIRQCAEAIRSRTK